MLVEIAPGGTADPDPPPRGRLSRFARQWPGLLVLLVVTVGVAAALDHHWRKGVYVVGAGLAVACVLRAVLPAPRVGMLAVRSRRVDVLQTGVVGVGLLLLGALIPPVPPSL